MALSPEFQTLVETLHEDVRDEAWAGRVVDSYQAVYEQIGSELERSEAGEFLAPQYIDAIQEVLRQHVDERILNDVLAVTDGLVAEDFEEQLVETASSWPTNLIIFSEEEELRPNEQYTEIDADAARRLQEASREGNTVEIMQLLLTLQQRVDVEPGYAPRLTEEGIAGSLSHVGQALFDYIQDIIHQGNQNQGPRVFAEVEAGASTVTTSMNPAMMEQAIRTAIMTDIQNGTFPIDGMDIHDAARIASAIVQAIPDEDDFITAQAGRGPVNKIYEIDPGALAQAIDGLFLGEEPTLQADMTAGLTAHQFGQEYAEVLNVWGAGMTPDHLIEHFTNLVEGYENYNTGEQVPPEINIPEFMREQFYAEIYEAFEASRAEGEWDPDAFGEHMFEQFGLIDEQYQAPMLRDRLDYGEPISLGLGRETENGIMAVSPDGQEMFEINLGDDGFTIYAATGEGEGFNFDGMADVNTMEELRELFGEEGFTIRAVTHLDEGLDNENSQLAGYYIQTPDSHRFYVGFDAIPESGVTPEFRALRDSTLDQQSRVPDLEIDTTLTVGGAEAVAEADEPEVTVTEYERPLGTMGPF